MGLNKLEKKDRLFLLAMLVFCALCTMYYFRAEMSEYNITLYVFSYKYGFISRGLVGTVWQWLDSVLPFDLMNYFSIYNTNLLITGIFYLFFFVLYYFILRIVPATEKSNAKYLMVFMSIFTFPMFVTRQNMGRIDIYLIMITIICICLIICKKAEWLIIPLCIVAMLIHQGFVFTNINIILVLLLYRFFTSEHKVKYITIFVTTLISVSALFLYFEFYSHSLGNEVYNEIVENAKNISPNGEYYEMLLKHEILGLDVYEDEYFWHLQNVVELPIFAVLMSPYLVLAFIFFKDILKKAASKEGVKNESDRKKNIFIYIIIVVGALTLLPEWFLKVDFGRYVYETVFYYISIAMALMCLQDRIVTESIHKIRSIVSKRIFGILLVAYPMLFMPLYDTEISRLTYQILRFIGFRE